MGLKIYDSNGILKTGTGGSGETNTASNIGTDGVGVWDQKIGVDLQFRNVASTQDEFLTVTLDAGDNDIDLALLGSPTVKVLALKGTAGTINPGDVVYVSGWNVGDGVIEIELADADDSAKMPAVGIAEDTITNVAQGAVIVVGPVTDNTTGLAVGDAIYVSTTAGAWTDTRPTGTTAAIQKIATVIQVGASGKMFVAGALRSNDVPNLQDAYFWVGNASNRATAVTMSGEATMTNAGVVTVADGADGTAIHDNVAGEITAITEKVTPASADVLLIEDSAAGNVKKRLQIANLPAGSLPATVVETDQSNTYTTGTQNFVAATDVVFKDTALQIQDDAAPTKVMRFDASAISAGTTRTYTTPNVSTALAGAAGTLTLSSKTLDNSCDITVKDAFLTVQDDSDPTKQARFQCSAIPTLTTRTYILPSTGGTFLMLGEALGTPSSGTLTNCTGLPTGGLVDDAVTYGKMQNVVGNNVVLGNNAGAGGIVDELTGTEVTAILDNFVGDSGAGGTKGLVPAPAAGDAAAGKFLKADGNWTAPAGSGDVVGPASATDGVPALFDGTTGKLIKNSTPTGTGNPVLATSPTLVTPNLGTPSAGSLGSCTAYEGTAIASTGEVGGTKYLREDGDGTCSWQAVAVSEVNNLAADGIAGIADDQLAVGTGAGTAAYQTLPNGAVAYSTTGGTFSQAGASNLSDGTTGSGSIVLATSPTLVTPAIGTPSSGTLTNCTGLPTGGLVDDAVTYAKMQNVSATDKVLGRSTAGAGDVEEIACTAAGRALIDDADAATQRATLGLTEANIEFVIDGGGSAITTGEKGHLEIPFACTIVGWTILADQSGSIVVDVWKDTYANFPPTVADTIAGSEKPTLSTAQKNQDLTLTTWTTSCSKGDILAFNVDSASTVTRVLVSIRVTR